MMLVCGCVPVCVPLKDFSERRTDDRPFQTGWVWSDGVKYGQRKLRHAVLVTGGKERTLKCRHIDFFYLFSG